MVSYCFADGSIIVHLAPSPNTNSKKMVNITQEEIDMYLELTRAAGGQVRLEVDKNSWYILEFKWNLNSK
eukprot:12655384-Ditylum_brightwellii.AAC.1